MTRFDTRVITTEAELGQQAAAWEALRSALPEPRLEHERSWLEGEARTKQGMMVVALKEGGETRAIAPFLMKKWKLQCRLGYKSVVAFPMRMARLCGDALLAPDGDPTLQEQLLEAVAKADQPYQTIFIESLPVASSLRKLIDTSPVVKEHFTTYFPSPPAKHWQIKLPKTWEEYNAALGSEQRRQFRQREKKLTDKTGAIEFVRFSAVKDVPEYIRALDHLTKLSWQGRQLGQQISPGSPGAKRIEEFAQNGWLRGYLLRTTDGKKPIAFGLGFQCGGVYYYDTIGYDPDFASFSPGNLVLYKLVEDLFKEDPASGVDLGGGDNLYKRIFGNASYDEQHVFLFRKSAYTSVAVTTHGAFAKASTVARETLQRTGLLEKARRFVRTGKLTPEPAAPPPAQEAKPASQEAAKAPEQKKENSPPQGAKQQGQGQTQGQKQQKQPKQPKPQRPNKPRPPGMGGPEAKSEVNGQSTKERGPEEPKPEAKPS